jgi:hypothetical protein
VIVLLAVLLSTMLYILYIVVSMSSLYLCNMVIVLLAVLLSTILYILYIVVSMSSLYLCNMVIRIRYVSLKYQWI